MSTESETIKAVATAFVDYGEALRVLEWLRGNGLLATDESDEALAEQYAFMYAGPVTGDALALVKSRHAEAAAAQKKPRRRS